MGKSYNVVDWFKNKYLNYADPPPGPDSIISSWPFMTTLAWPISIMILYFSIVTWIGPKFMERYYPFQIKQFASRYNMILTGSNLVLGLLLSSLMILEKYSFLCQPVQKYESNDDEISLENMIAILIWIYHVSKIVQLLDGVLGLLRHRDIAIVHTLHHCLMILLSWVAAKYVPGGSTAVLITMSCFTHVIIFSYYKFSDDLAPDSSWPKFQKVAPIVQLVQFVLVGLVAISSLCLSCNYPTWASITIFAGIVGFTMMLFVPNASCGGWWNQFCLSS